MLCIDNRNTDIYFNLAAEEFLLKKSKENYFMLWQDTASVVVGKHQSVEAEVNVDFAEQQNILLARRLSGGGTVYHDSGNVNLTFIATAKQPDFEYYLQQTVDCLTSMGLAIDSDPRLGLYIGNEKISGSAQSVHKDRVLYHCTLLFNTDLQVLNAVLRGEQEEGFPLSDKRRVRAVPSVRSLVTNISQHLDVEPDVRRFARLILRYFLDNEVENRMYRFTQEDVVAIQKLRDQKYACREWILHAQLPHLTVSE